MSCVVGKIPENVTLKQVHKFLTTQVSPIPCSMDVRSRLGLSHSQVEVTGLFVDGLFGSLIAEVSLDVLVALASEL